MDILKFGGAEIDLDSVSETMLRNIREGLVQRCDEYLGYVATLDFKLLQRAQNPLFELEPDSAHVDSD